MKGHSVAITVKGFETATALLSPYSKLALAHRQRISQVANIASIREEDKPEVFDLGNSLALISLNAAIIEGGLRTILIEKISSDIDEKTREGMSEGRTSPSKMEQLLRRYREDVEMQGGWDKLKSQYLFYFEVNISKIIKEDTRDGIEALFTIRNVVAHGTALMQPTEQMDETLKDQYPFIWQRKLQGAAVYLKKQYKKEDFFDNLASPELPSLFWTLTKEFFENVETTINPSSSRSKDLISRVKSYSFGFRP